MKKWVIGVAAGLMYILSAFPAAALSADAIPYATYQYDSSGRATRSPHAYVPKAYMTAADMGTDSFAGASDLKIDASGEMYIADSAHDRVLVFGQNGQKKREIASFSFDGRTDALSDPTGLQITAEGHLYVCDRGNKRLLEFDAAGNCLRSIGKPPEELLPEGYNFSPSSVAVDRWGRIYLVSAGTTYGIMEFDSDGNFQSFLGAQKTTPSFTWLLWRRIFSKEQQERSYSVVPVNYDHIFIDDGGFLYATSQNANVPMVEAAVLGRVTDSTFLPVKKLNFTGADVMPRKGFFPPAGDISFGNGAEVEDAYKGTSRIVGVAIGDNGLYTLVDQKRNKLFSYDADGNLLYVFGGTGNRRGMFQSLCAAAYYDGCLYALDSSASAVTCFAPTAYGELISRTIALREEREYDKVMAGWQEILRENNGFTLAYVGMGDAAYRQEEFAAAMQYYKLADDTAGYSKAFSGLRREWMSRWYLPVLAAAAALLFGLTRLLAAIRRRNACPAGKRTLFDQLLYAFHVLAHPFDGFWDIRYEGRGSKKAATVLFLLAALSLWLRQLVTGWLFGGGDGSLWSIVIFGGAAALFILSNWCLTTLTDGKGAMGDIYTAVGYSLTPLILTALPLGLLTNVLSLGESGALSLMSSAVWIWVGLLLFSGILVTQHYSFGQNVLSVLLTVVGMMVLLFIGFLLVNLAGRMVTFVANIVTELSLRW